jgi:hypothetical protein
MGINDGVRGIIGPKETTGSAGVYAAFSVAEKGGSTIADSI